MYISVSRFDTSFCFFSLITQRVFSVWTLVCFFSSGLFFSHQVFKYCISATTPIFLGWSTYWHLCLPFTFHIVQLLLHICFCPFLFLLMLIPGWICKCYFSIYYLFSEGLDLSQETPKFLLFYLLVQNLKVTKWYIANMAFPPCICLLAIGSPPSLHLCYHLYCFLSKVWYACTICDIVLYM